jgi:hypothetical protein
MPIDYSDLNQVKEALKRDQEAEHDRREKVREIHNFLDKPDGQWEPKIVTQLSGRPRYTLDKCNPVVDDIAGEMEQADFGIRVRPAGGEATDDDAKIFDGIIRNIQAMSNAEYIYDSAARNMIRAGIDGWEVVQDWVDGDSFDQDLLIKPISNFHDRVWFDSGAELQTMADANHVTVLQAMSKSEYQERWPDGSGKSVGSDQETQVYSFKPDKIVVGRILWMKPTDIELVLMSNGAVYEVDDNFDSIKDELEQAGITEKRRRTRQSHVVMSRIFDGGDWLTDEKETVFRKLPIIPTYGNFKITENKVIYWGAVEKLMDPQRIYNYAKSREIEEGALAPRKKILATSEQITGYEKEWQTANTNADPVLPYNHVEKQPPPFETGGPQINPNLANTAQGALRDIETSAGIFGPSRGEDEGMRSGVAIEKLQNKADSSKIKYTRSQEIAITRTAEVLVDAIPRVYDSKRTVRILNEDDSIEMITLHDVIIDEETGQPVEVYDLSKGQYDVVCEVGPAFKNRQQETVATINEMAAIDPSIIQEGGDILLQNVNAPGVNMIAERRRQRMVMQGLIPVNQLNEEEREMLAQLQAQPQEPDPVQQMALATAQAELENAQTNTAETQANIQLKADQQQFDQQVELANLDEAREKQDLAEFLAFQKEQREESKLVLDALAQQAQALKDLREAMGVDTIVGPGNTEAYKQQAEVVTDLQAETK